MVQAACIIISILCAGLVATVMTVVFVVNGRLQKDAARLEMENKSLRRENQRLRDEARRRGVRLASRVTRRAGW